MNLQSVAVCLLGIIFSSMHFFLSTRHILFCTIKGCRSSLKSPHYIFNMQSCILLHQVTARYFWIFLPKFHIYFSLFILKSIQITTIIDICPIHVVTFTLISILATDYIQKRRGQALLFSFEYNLSPNLISK